MNKHERKYLEKERGWRISCSSPFVATSATSKSQPKRVILRLRVNQFEGRDTSEYDWYHIKLLWLSRSLLPRLSLSDMSPMRQLQPKRPLQASVKLATPLSMLLDRCVAENVSS